MIQNLSIQQIEEIVTNNLYSYTGNPYISRCFDLDYSNSINLPALSLPGGDLGDIFILISASLTAGFIVHIDKAINTLYELIGGKENSTFYFSHEHSLELCKYSKSIREYGKEYDLDSQAQKKVVELEKEIGPSSNSNSIYRQITPNACLIIEAEYGLFPNYSYSSSQYILNANFLVFQRTYINRRHRELSNLWVQNGSVELFSGLNSDYLYEILSETTENHLFEILKISYSKVPLYFASISPDKKINIQEY